MEQIKAIKVENFQSHADTRLEFDDGLNVITGPSDEGKSALIRALRWVLYNEPLGDEFIQIGKKNCRVTLELANDYQIIRQRTPSKNRYIIVAPEGEKKVLERIGRGVPDEIVEIHQMPKIELDTDYETTLNLDYQLDGAFLLNESGSNRAKALGRLLDVHLVDAASRNTNTDISRLKQKEKDLAAEVDRIEEELEEFSDLPKLKEEITQQQKLLAKIKANQEKLENLKSLQDKWERLQKEITRVNKIIDQIGELETIKELVTEGTDKYRRLKEWKKLQLDWQQKEEQINKGKQYLQEFSEINQAAKLVTRLEELRIRFSDLHQAQQKQEKLNQEFTLVKKVVAKTKQVAKAKELLAKGTEVIDKLQRTTKFYQQWQELKQKINSQQQFLAAFSSAEEQTKLKSKIDKKQQKLKSLQQLLTDWKKVNDRINKGQDFLQTVVKEKNTWLEEYKEILTRLGRCPTCFSEVDDQIVEQIIANYKEDK